MSFYGYFLCLFSPLLFFLLCGMWGTNPHRLIVCCSITLELYALSRQRCWWFLLFVLLSFGEDDKDGRLITILSITSVTTFTSWVFVDVMTAAVESGTPFLSVKICLFVPSLLLSIGLFPVFAPYRWLYGYTVRRWLLP